jgi:uncharacterized protein
VILKADYRDHAQFFAPALPSAALWRLVLGLVGASALYLFLSQLFFQLAYGLAGPEGESLSGDMMAGKTPLAMYLLLFSFGLMIFATGASVRLLHHRSFGSLFGPSRAALRQGGRVAAFLALLTVVTYLLPPWDMGGTFEANMPLGRWLMLLPLSLLAVLVQVSAEEVLFRGYIQQQLAARFRSPLIWMVLPAALFALGHYLPDAAGQNAMLIALWAGVFGMLMADLTARAGSLGPAIAVHFWNNVSAIVLVSLPDDLSGLALYLAPFSMADEAATRSWLPVDFAMMLVAWLTARLAIRR